MIEHGFQPTRSVVLSFGFDEETSGLNGAAELAKALLLTYGEHAFAFIVDEGGAYFALIIAFYRMKCAIRWVPGAIWHDICHTWNR